MFKWQTIFQSSCAITSPTSNVWEFQFLHNLVSIWYCQFLFCFGYPNRYVVVSRGFNLLFPPLHFEHCFHVFFICISLLKYLFRSFAYFLIGVFVFLLLSLRSSLYILDTSLLSDMWLAIIFSQLMACLFILLKLPFKEPKSIILMKSNLSNFKKWILFLILYLRTFT